MDKKKRNLFLILIILSGFFLRFFHLGRHSLWCDELLAISLGKHSIGWIVEYITYKDAHPPLFYIMVHYWMKLGESEFFLRILPLIFGVLCIPFAYLLGKKFKDEKTGILLSLFLSLSPSYILWSQILKSYTFFTFLTILSFISFFNLLDNQKKGWFVSLFLTDTLILYTHNFGFIAILIQIFSLLILRRLNKKFIFCFMAILIFYIPWLLRIPYQFKFTLGVRRPIPSFFRFPYTLFYFFLGETINPFNFKILIPIFLIFLLLIITGLKNINQLERERKFILLISIFLPLIFVFFPSTVPQNLIPFAVFYLILFTLFIYNLDKKNILLYFAFLPFFPPLIFYYSDNISQYQDASKLIPFREIYKEIEKREIENDLLLTTENIDKVMLAPIQWYYKGKCRILEIESQDNLEKFYGIIENSNRIFLVLDFVNRPLISEKLKEFFEENFDKIWEKKYVYNEKILSRLKGEREFYYLWEVYLFKKPQ